MAPATKHVSVLSSHFVRPSKKANAYRCPYGSGSDRCQCIRTVDLDESIHGQDGPPKADETLASIRAKPFEMGYEDLCAIGEEMYGYWNCKKHNVPVIVQEMTTDMLGELGWSEDWRRMRSGNETDEAATMRLKRPRRLPALRPDDIRTPTVWVSLLIIAGLVVLVTVLWSVPDHTGRDRD